MPINIACSFFTWSLVKKIYSLKNLSFEKFSGAIFSEIKISALSIMQARSEVAQEANDSITPLREQRAILFGRGGGKSCKADEIFTRNETRHYGVTCHDKRGLSYVRYWIIDGRRVLGYSCVACIDGLTVPTLLFPQADFPAKRFRDDPFRIIIRRLDFFLFFLEDV